MSPDLDIANNALFGGFVTTVARLVHAAGTTAYSYQLQGNGSTATPLIDLTSAIPSVVTDCSGWVNYALNSVAPLHQAVLSAARDGSSYNGVLNVAYDASDNKYRAIALDEATRYPWSRAFVLANAFATTDADNGFSSVPDFSALRSGDLIAYALGIYTDPANRNAQFRDALGYTGDTGHTMVVTGAPIEVWHQGASVSTAQLADVQSVQAANGRHGAETLASGAVSVWAVPVVDSSVLPHMTDADGITQPATDDRLDAAGKYTLPADTSSLPSDAQAGGLGTGTMWFSLDASGKPLQFRFGLHDSWHPNTSDATASSIAAARMTSEINLSGSMLGADGLLHVSLLANRTDNLANPDGSSGGYAMSERLQGSGGLDVSGAGTLTLSGRNDFAGGIVLHGVGLLLQDAGSAGTGVVTTQAGTSNAITVAHGGVRVMGAGQDTVSAAEGGSTVTGGQSLLFLGAAGGSTVSGGSGSATVVGGASGLYQGGAAGHNQLFSAGGGATLVGGGAGDLLVGGTGDTLLAAAGNATLFGGAGSALADADGSTAILGGQATVFAAAGSDTVYAGMGDALVLGGAGATTLVGSTGLVSAWVGTGSLTEFAGSGGGTLVAGNGTGTLVVGAEAGAQVIEVIAGHAGGQLSVSGFRPGTDRVALVGYNLASVAKSSAGSVLTLALPDSTTVTLASTTGGTGNLLMTTS